MRLGLLAVCVVMAIVLVRTGKLGLSHEAVLSQATHLIRTAGGSERICDQANEMFRRFGNARMRILRRADLADYPAISALGTVDGIWPGNPPYIKVRVGTQVRGFIIKIADPSSRVNDIQHSDGVDLTESCISVYR